MGDHRVKSAGLATGIAKVVAGTLLVGLLGDRIAAFYSEKSEAIRIKEELAGQVVMLTNQEAEGLQVLAGDLAPQSFLARRCFTSLGLPTSLEPGRAKICPDAVLAAVLDEQQRNLDVRAAHLQGLGLQSSMAATLSEPAPADRYRKILESLEWLRKLNSSTTCGEERVQSAHLLRLAYPWMDDELERRLVGPLAPEPCDFHGDPFPETASRVAQHLASEAGAVAADVRKGSVRELMDSRGDAVGGLLVDPLLLGLALLGLMAFGASKVGTRRSGDPPSGPTADPE